MIVRLGNFFFRYRTTVSPLLLLTLLIPGPDVLDDPVPAAFIGLGVACVGQLVRGATIGLRYIVRGGRDRRVYADDLVTEGLFRHVRNPMYVGKFFMVLGAGIASNRWPAMLAICVGYALIYHAIARAEEAYLAGKFSAAFEDYRRCVPRWLPRFEGLARTLASLPFSWKRVIAKEYSAPLGWTLPIVAVALYNIEHSAGLSNRPVATVFLVTWLCVVAALWLAAGWLKKTRSPILYADR